ncbi:MAG: tRNA pseudouridine(38-40) synthase TruA [Oscillospiraceae bacterium]|nr:tRNA pseudouridine(38-40) synthase TruA [Oscillospiraceae bacterium]
MRNLLFKLQYAGTKYHGWQVQENALAVQQVVQDGVHRITGNRDGVTGCSRLDSGVHAAAYYFTVRTQCALAADKFAPALNTVLPRDMAVLDCCEVSPSFHPRYSAVNKTYEYKIWNSKYRNPFYEKLMWHYPHNINLSKLKETAEGFIGTHDFSSFCAARAKKQDSHVRTIFTFEAEKNDGILTLRITGDGFLYNMVRIITGTLVDLRRQNVTREDISEIISAGDRSKAGKTAPAHGLYLVGVEYERQYCANISAFFS